MYSPSETSSVLLGVPSHNAKASSDPYVTKIGGNPVWHDPDVAPNPSVIICKSCNSCKNIVLVAQIFAPVDNLDRSLYVFACNTRKCSLSSFGWRVYKNQKIKDSISEVKNVTVGKSNPTSIWGPLNAENDVNLTFDDLNSLLMTRDESLHNICTNNNSNKSFQGVANVESNVRSSQFCETVWPCIIVDSITEALKCCDYDEDDLVFNDTNVGDEKVYSLLQSYMVNEEDKELVEVIRTYTASNGNINHGNKCSFHKNDDGTESLDRKLARKDDKSKAELYFQQIVSYESKQVLRYAYGGEPLWCTKPYPVEYQNKDHGGIRKCTVCNSSKVFEFQLMPALLSYVPNDNSSTVLKDTNFMESLVISNAPGEENEHDSDNDIDDSINHTVAQSHLSREMLDAFIQTLGNNLDFGVVGIWSCPNSCQAEHEEAVIVQPPSDIAI